MYILDASNNNLDGWFGSSFQPACSAVPYLCQVLAKPSPETSPHQSIINPKTLHLPLQQLEKKVSDIMGRENLTVN